MRTFDEIATLPDLAGEHDWSIPCGSLYHERVGGGPAVWAVWQSKCCPARPDFGYACAACLSFILVLLARPRCRDCGWRGADMLVRDTILRVERLSSRPAEVRP